MKANPNLYLLQDGTYADPKDCSKGKDGVLRHKNGLAVASGENGEPFTLGDASKLNAEAAKAGSEQHAGGPAKVLTTDEVEPKAGTTDNDGDARRNVKP